jgi:hypothetical protein
MKIDITGLNKAQLLVALYNNAKTSEWTKATIGNEICPDEFVRNMHKDIFQPRIDKRIQELSLTEEDANQLLNSKRNQIDYIGPVCIKINLSGNEIDTEWYDKTHNKNGGAELAEIVVTKLKAGNSKMHLMYAGAAGVAVAATLAITGGSQPNASSAAKNKF